MKSKQRLRIGGCVGSLLLLGALFTQEAGAGSSWLQVPANLFGFGADLLDVSRITLDGRSQVTATRNVSLARAGVYQVPDRNGVRWPITIRITEKAGLESKFGLEGGGGFYSQANINDFPTAFMDFDAYDHKSWAVFLGAQAFIVCNNATFSSDAVGGPGSSTRLGTGGSYSIDVRISSCPDGSLPINGQAAYIHGIRGGQ